MIGITLGEHFGIGYEILAKSLPYIDHLPVKLYGDKQAFLTTCRDLAITPSENLLWHNIECQASQIDHKVARANYVINQLEQATKDALHGITTGLLTCPIDKNIVRACNPDFDGHTSYLQKLTHADHSIMLMRNRDFSIIVGTQHIPLREVSLTFTQKYLEKLVCDIQQAYAHHFRQDNLRMACLGINPHAGEIDSQAEEKQWMHQSIANMHKEGIDIHGPFPADSFFTKARNQNWDVIISPYHDQALIAAKYNGLADVVNITLGLPFLRTSPGHGVAYDIAGKNQADPSSFQNAMRVITEKSLYIVNNEINA